jgi:adenosine deaminase CECR1
MMKGLFAYRSAYCNYTRACIKDFVEDNIQYAEVRPNFMTTNQLKTDDGGSVLNNEDIMRILNDGVRSTLAEIREEGGYFADMKVIYCTPRSFNNAATAKSLNECIELKKKFSHLICGKLGNSCKYVLNG